MAAARTDEILACVGCGSGRNDLVCGEVGLRRNRVVAPDADAIIRAPLTASSSMKLIGSHTSPFARKARIVLAEKRIEYEFVTTDVHAPDSPVPNYNPLGKIPVLITDDGAAIYDSSVIVEYLDTVSPVGRLIPEPGRQRIQVKRWEALCDGLLDAAILVVLEKRRPSVEQQQHLIARQRDKVAHALRAASQDLGERAWCATEAYTLADITLGCALGYLDLRFPELDWRAQYPNLGRYAEKLFKRPAFQATVPV
jgi:glutathione S-transferase